MCLQDYLQGQFTYENVNYEIFKRKIHSMASGSYYRISNDDTAPTYDDRNNISLITNDYIITESEEDMSDTTCVTEYIGDYNHRYHFYNYIPFAITNFNVEELLIPLKFKLIHKIDKSNVIILKYNNFGHNPNQFIDDVLKCKKLKKITFGYEKNCCMFDYIIKKLKDTDIKLYYKNYSDHNNIIEIN